MFFKKKEPSLGDLGYPTPADAMPDEWVASAEALEKALRDLGVDARVEARNNGTPGSDLLIVFFSFFVVFVDRHQDRWVFGLPNPRGGGEKQWFDDLEGFKNLPARAVAIQVVARGMIFMMNFLDFISDMPQETKDRFEVDQVLLLQLIKASTTAAIPGHWLEIDPKVSDVEDKYLTIFGKTAEKRIEHELSAAGINFKSS